MLLPLTNNVTTEVNSQGGHEYLRRYRTGLAPAQRDGKRWGDPNDPRFGDVHFYDYDMDCEEAGGYPRYENSRNMIMLRTDNVLLFCCLGGEAGSFFGGGGVFF